MSSASTDIGGLSPASIPVVVISVRTRLSERTARDLLGVEALTAAFGGETVEIGGGPTRRPEGWSAVLEACRPPLERAGDEVEAALRRGEPPLTVATDCGLAIATLPAVHRALPAACVLWLDAHYDFWDPEDGDDFLGSMALSGACGAWTTGFSPSLPPGQVVLAGARSRAGADPERVAAAGVTILEPARATERLAGHDVYVHLDPDVLDPAAYAAEFPEPGGLRLEELAALLRSVAERARIVGIEVTALHAPERTAGIVDVLSLGTTPRYSGGAA
jgi:arginase family enzyme